MTSRLDVLPVDGRSDRWALRACPVEQRYIKDYDHLPGHRPAEWASRFDLSKWWFAAAFLDDRRVAGAAVVIDTSDLDGPAGANRDAAVLWDFRVAPDCRRQGVGRQLIGFVEDHVRAMGIPALKVETQNINVPACRFYERAGYVLCDVNRFAYADLPDEVQLIWRKTWREG